MGVSTPPTAQDSDVTGGCMPLDAVRKIKFDDAVKRAEDHMEWVEASLHSPSGDWSGDHGREIEYRTAAAAARAAVARAHALEGRA